jgi:hypothetical protein
MRRDLVEEILADVADEMFEDVTYVPPGGGAATPISKAIFGIEEFREEFEQWGQRHAEETHVTRALRAKFPDLARGAVINDGFDSYKVLDFKPTGDGRLEILISLKKI